MRKISIGLMCIFLTPSMASARDGAYIGADALWTSAKYKYHNKRVMEQAEGKYTRARDVGFGFNAGYKIGLNTITGQSLVEKVFIAPEVFFDSVRSKGHDTAYLSNNSAGNFVNDKIQIQSRHGIKLNIGYDITPKLNVFVNAGFTKVKWKNSYLYDNVTEKGVRSAPIYGLGIAYNLDDNWAIRAAADYQQFFIPNSSFYAGSHGAWVTKVTLETFKVGAAYRF